MSSPQEPAVPRAACRACSAALGEGAFFCARCGAPQPGAPSCPHCGAPADVRPHGELRFACNVCGGPRLAVDEPGHVPDAAEVAPLRQAELARKGRALWRVAAGAGALLGGSTLALFGLIALFASSLTWFAAGVIAALPFLALALLGHRRARRRSRELSAALDEALAATALTLARRSDAPLSASRLRRALRLGASEAERVLALLAAHDELRSVVWEGELAYAPRLLAGAAVGAGDGAAGPLRIDVALDVPERAAPHLDPHADDVHPTGGDEAQARRRT